MTRVYIDDDFDGFDLLRALGEISHERREYAMRYRYDLDRRLSVAAYLLLKRALREVFGLNENPRLTLGHNGKPYLPDHPEIHFNFSHCPRAAVCAVSNRPIGIDVEAIAPVDWVVAERVLSTMELSEVRSVADPDVAFARFWTRKEAFVKLTGDGLEEPRLQQLLDTSAGCNFSTSVFPAGGYVLSVAELVCEGLKLRR